MTINLDVAIVGGGISGLVSAYECQHKGLNMLLIEAESRVGGRVQSDVINGVICDRGFQVFLPAYPIASSILKECALEWCYYPREALIIDNKKTWFGVPSFAQIIKPDRKIIWPEVKDMIQLTRDAYTGIKEKTKHLSDISIKTHLSTKYSTNFRKRFLDPFFRGVFLDKDLSSSKSLFQFYLWMFLKGGAAIPRLGMGEISRQLGNTVKKEKILLDTSVERIEKQNGMWHISTNTGVKIASKAIIIATEKMTTEFFLKDIEDKDPPLPVSTHFFLADKEATKELRPLTLFPDGNMLHHLAIPSQINPSITNNSNDLIMVTTYGQTIVDKKLVKNELKKKGLQSVQDWEWIHHIGIKRALPRINRFQKQKDPSCIIAGDWTTFPSIEGACQSGMSAGKRVALLFNN
jgi:protoporphyrinogen oxidase